MSVTEFLRNELRIAETQRAVAADAHCRRNASLRFFYGLLSREDFQINCVSEKSDGDGLQGRRDVSLFQILLGQITSLVEEEILGFARRYR